MVHRRTHVYGVYGIYSAYRHTNRNTPERFKARRPWIVGYRGPPLPKTKGTDKPEWPISNLVYWRHRRHLDREFNVMKCLATPYLDKSTEAPYISKYGTSMEREQKTSEILDQLRMPGEPKVVSGNKKADKRRANEGNLLHAHRTIEDCLGALTFDRRFE